jgi:hypothetical protein
MSIHDPSTLMYQVGRMGWSGNSMSVGAAFGSTSTDDRPFRIKKLRYRRFCRAASSLPTGTAANLSYADLHQILANDQLPGKVVLRLP